MELNDLPLSYRDYRELEKPALKGEIDILLDRTIQIENAGTILRTAEGLGVRTVYFYQPVFKWNSHQLKKISRSVSTFYPYKIISNLEDIDWQKYKSVYGLEWTHQSISIYNFSSQLPCLLIAGSESSGISNELLRLTDQNLHIPLVGKQSSINLSHSVAIALSTFHRMRISS